MNVIDELGILAISTRLQRLSEQLRKDGVLIYKDCGIDFEPKWFPVIYTLYRKPGLGVVELAAEIGYAHPSTISLLKELEKERLILSRKDRQDERKRILRLSDKGKQLVQEMEPVWKIMTEAIEEITNTRNNLMKAIIEVEARLRERSFFERARSHKKTG
ncbi:MAG: MarR family transcriptional regulator [Bacteroidetes bacterium]|nr:MarR family transcriptional regulator [Bacteroidota bacterium]